MVLGASGFIGRWVTSLLLRTGARVWAVARDPVAAKQAVTSPSASVLVREGSVEDPDSVRAVLSEARPSVTFNLIGYGVRPGEDDADVAHRVNARFPAVLAGLVAEARESAWPGNALVHAGSQAEYGPIRRLSESAEPRPVSTYGVTKLEGARAVARASREHRFPAVVARVFNVYGPGEPAHRLLPMLLRRAGDAEPIDLTSGIQERSFTYVEDVAEGLVRLGAARPLRGDPVNLASEALVTVRTLVREAARQLHISEDRLRFGALPDRPSEEPSLLVSTRRLEELTGWTPPTSLEAGIERTVADAQRSSDTEQR